MIKKSKKNKKKQKLINISEKQKTIIAIVIIVLGLGIGVYKIVTSSDSNNDIANDFDEINKIVDTDKGNKTDNAPQTPEIEELKEVKQSENTLCNPANCYSLTIPDGYEVYSSEGYNYLRNSKTGTQISIITTDENTYPDSTSVWEDLKRYLYRSVGYVNKENVKINNYGASKKDIVTVNGKKYLKETAKIDYYDSKMIVRTYPMEAYYGIYSSPYKKELKDYQTEGYYGLFIIGSTDDEDKTKLKADMEVVVNSFKTYTPTEKDVNVELTKFTSEKSDKTSFMYPADWTVERNEDGMIIISAPANNSVYSGMAIHFMSDPEGKFVEDHAQFAQDYERQILSTFFTQNVGEDGFDYNTSVTDMDLEKKIGKKEAICFDIVDIIEPNFNNAAYSMVRNVRSINSKRYTFKSQNIDCMLNFFVPNEHCVKLAEKIANSLEIK